MRAGGQGALVLAAAVAVAAVSARDHAGGWNDGSRLAAAEALVDHGTWAIDDSIFVRVPPPGDAPPPYPPDESFLLREGTLDKLRIDGRYYSDKPPVPNLLLAVEYRAWQAVTGRTARSDVAGFCRALTFVSSGLAFVVAVWGAFRLAVLVGLGAGWRFALTLSFACGSVAWAYSGYVNGHIQLLAVVMLALVAVVRLLKEPSAERVMWLGCLAGLGYTLDLGAGPPLLAALGLWVTLRLRRWRLAVAFGVAALPWLLLHHSLNYAIAGTWGPANAVPENLAWPGSPFAAATMTGRWNHDGPGSFVAYALNLLIGRRGFLWHNPPLLLAVVGAPLLLFWGQVSNLPPGQGKLKTCPHKPELLLVGGYAVAVWLLYAATSVNGSGGCCSVRWFVPLLGPGYFVLALLLRDRPEHRGGFAVLAAVGLVLGPVMAWLGPWDDLRPRWLWPAVGVMLLGWALSALFALPRARRLAPAAA
jgi:hypothetical protein